MSRLWLESQASQSRSDALENFARETMMACQRRLPGGKLTGILKGRESDIRQDALEMLFAKYLRGNKALEAATRAKNADDVERHLSASIGACVFIALRRHSRKAFREVARHIPLEEVAPPPSYPPILESAETRQENEARLRSRALLLTLNTGKITPKNYRIGAMYMEHGMSVKNIADIEHVSPNAIYQQLRRIAPSLKQAINELDAV